MKNSTRKTLAIFALRFLFIIAFVAGFACPLPAQTFYGSIVGTVTDATGAVVPGGTVSLTNLGTAERKTAVTDSAGNFSNAVSAKMGVLLGDVDGSGRVDGTDVSLVRQQNFQPLTQDPPTFRYDISASGRIDGTDVSIARQQNFTVLPH